ncbi:MAG: phosphoribosylanthranilate isomerase [Actinomycetota bacterium]
MKEFPKHLVKICGLTTSADTRYAVEHGATAVGFIFAPSSRQVTTTQARDLSAVAASVLRVGVMKDLNPKEIIEVVDNVELDAVQLHDAPSDDLVAELRGRELGLLAVHHRGDDFLGLTADFDAWLFDNPEPGSGVANDFRALGKTCFQGPIVLAGGLDPDNVGDIIRTLHPYGVDVASGVESSPGIKDLGKVLAFITTANKAFEEQ